MRGRGRACPAQTTLQLARAGIDDVAEFDATVGRLFDEGASINALPVAYGLSADAIRSSLKRTGRARPSLAEPLSAEEIRLRFFGGCSICDKPPWLAQGVGWLCGHAAALRAGFVCALVRPVESR